MPEHQLVVGGSYDPSRTGTDPSERVRLGRSTPELVRFWPEPTVDEVAAHTSGAAHFALTDESPDLLVLAYRFGDLAWSDAPFQAHRLTSDQIAWPSGGPAAGILFRTVLADAGAGTVLALRYDLWSVEFSNAVRVAIAEQLLHEFSDDTAGKKLNALYGAYKNPELMVSERAVATCVSDEPTISGTGLSVHHY